MHPLSRAKVARYLIATPCFPVCRNAEIHDIRCWHKGQSIGRQRGQVVGGRSGPEEVDNDCGPDRGGRCMVFDSVSC